ncbi:hypothetical protein BRADI_2g02173v3 [Brachypodium distachyon]|uniref:Uncharacterized protein n=1 Tax=Brachypodium distachyon TaxID=15368 RepID=A0A0Q3FTL0_BRADI|nr:hypothetical protein BRADI_2g02173v3 [Brachypodium distachyon]
MDQQDALAVHDLSAQGGDEGSMGPGRVLEVESSVHGATLESVKKGNHVGESSAPAPVTASGSGTKVAMAHASPPDSYRRVPSRSRKQYSPQRFIATQPAALDDDTPSRDRKHPRPEHFIPEEAEASAAAKSRRSNIVVDRFLSSSILHGSPTETSSEQAGGRVRGVGAAASRLGPACVTPGRASPSATAELNGSARIYIVIAILGASLALSVVSCLLFYLVGRRSGSEPGPPPGEKF